MTLPEIIQAANLLRTGGLVAFPTETVYGLGADATNEVAIEKVFRAKERPFDHPLIVHIGNPSHLHQWAREVPESAKQLAAAFWPGPLTMILPKQAHVLDCVTGAQDSVGLRMPNHPVALALLTAFGGGIVGPSANKFTHISPTSAAAVRQELGQVVDMILDGGACEVGLESTIIDLTQAVPVILRPGMIGAAAIEQVLNQAVLIKRQDTTATRAAGMHQLHYAPTTKTSLIDASQLASLTSEAAPIAILTHSQTIPPAKNRIVINMPNTAQAYAHELYQTLRDVDNQNYQHIFIETVPFESDWDAIRDRLKKASGS